MRHARTGRKLGRRPDHRNLMLRTMVTQLFTHGRIRTTETRAKEIRPFAEKIITLAKRGDLHARRQVLSELTDKPVVARLFKDIAAWYEKRAGGYTRILKLENRPGDNAPMAFIELVDRKELGPIKKVIPQKKKFKKKETAGAEKPAAKKKPAVAKKMAPAKKTEK